MSEKYIFKTVEEKKLSILFIILNLMKLMENNSINHWNIQIIKKIYFLNIIMKKKVKKKFYWLTDPFLNKFFFCDVVFFCEERLMEMIKEPLLYIYNLVSKINKKKFGEYFKYVLFLDIYKTIFFFFFKKIIYIYIYTDYNYK